MSRIPAPVLVERTLLMSGDEIDPIGLESLVNFQRGGRRLLLIAPRPRRWRPTRRAVDHDLAMQQELHRYFSRAGSELDGICYLPVGLFSRKSALTDELGAIAQRYERKVVDLVLIGSEPDLLKGFARAGGETIAVRADAVAGTDLQSLSEALKQLAAPTI